MADKNKIKTKQEAHDKLTKHIENTLQAIGPKLKKAIKDISDKKGISEDAKKTQIDEKTAAADKEFAQAIVSGIELAFEHFLSLVEVTIPEITKQDFDDLKAPKDGGAITGAIKPPKGEIQWKTTTST